MRAVSIGRPCRRQPPTVLSVCLALRERVGVMGPFALRFMQNFPLLRRIQRFHSHLMPPALHGHKHVPDGAIG